MPQLQAGQVPDSAAPKLYGIEKTDNTLPFQEKLMRLFKAHEFVTIQNIDDERIYWQYMPADGETETFDESGMMKQVWREKPEMWYIEPGAVEVLVGASAYRALDVMYKNVVAKKTLRRYKDPNSQVYDDSGKHLPRNFNFADGGSQDDFIKQAYLGKAVPSFGNQPAVTPANDFPAIDVSQAMQPAYAEPDMPSPDPIAAASNLVTANGKKH